MTSSSPTSVLCVESSVLYVESSALYVESHLMLDNPAIGDVLVELDIRSEDIAEMEYHLNECPMANLAVDNAVSYALSRVVKPGYRISVSVHGGSAVANIGDRKFPLGTDLSLWLATAMMGYSPVPLKSTLRLPEVIVRSKVAARRRKLQLLQFYKDRADSGPAEPMAAAG